MDGLSIKEKERIGKLLKYYRKKKKVQWKEIETKISTSTYRKIENGYISKKDEIYSKIFNLYKFPQIRKKKFKQWFNDYLNRMNDILEYYEEDKFDSLIKELEIELGPYKNTIIYEQYYQVIIYILNYYKYSKYMTIEEIEDCFLLFDCFEFEEIIMIYLLEVIFISNNNQYANYEILDKLFIETNKIVHPITCYLSAMYYKCYGELETSLFYFDKTLEYWKQNNYRKFKSLMGKFLIYKNIDKKKALKVIDVFIKLKNENKIYLSAISGLNYNIGMFYYIEGMYEKAYPLFWENVEKDNEIKEFVFICALCSKLNLSIPDKIKEMDYIENPYKIFLNYFKLKYMHKDNKELVEYIMQVVVPNKLVYIPYSQPFWEMFEEELMKICLIDKKYAIELVKYIDKKKKICGNN